MGAVLLSIHVAVAKVVIADRKEEAGAGDRLHGIGLCTRRLSWEFKDKEQDLLPWVCSRW